MMADHLEISDEVMEFFQTLSNDEPAATEEAPVTEAPVEEAQEPTEEAPVVEETVVPTEQVEEQQEPTEEPVSEEQTEEVNWEERYRHLQSQKDREVQAAQQQLDQLQQWAQQQYAWQQQVVADQQQQAQMAQQQQVVQVSREQIDSELDRNPIGAFQWVAANRPDLMPNVISMVREKEQLGHEVADAMMTEWTQFQMQQHSAQVQQQLEATQAQYQNQQVPGQVNDTMVQILGTLEARHGEPFKALSADIATQAIEKAESWKQYMHENGLEVTPQSVADFVTGVYYDIRESRLQTAASAPAKPVKLTPQQHVENPGANRQVESTPDQDAINELMEGARALGIDVSAPASV